MIGAEHGKPAPLPRDRVGRGGVRSCQHPTPAFPLSTARQVQLASKSGMAGLRARLDRSGNAEAGASLPEIGRSLAPATTRPYGGVVRGPVGYCVKVEEGERGACEKGQKGPKIMKIKRLKNGKF